MAILPLVPINLMSANEKLESVASLYDTHISDDEIICFINRNTLKFDNWERAVLLTGSGGSGILKPRLTTLVSIYLSCVEDIKVIKISGSSKNGYGSLDFLNDLLGNKKISMKQQANGNLIFVNSTEHGLRSYFDMAKINPSIDSFLQRYSFDETIGQLKIHGVLGEIAAQHALQKEALASNMKTVCIWSNLRNVPVDEVTAERSFDSDGTVIESIMEYKRVWQINDIKEARKVSRQLFEGRSDNIFWETSLRQAFVHYLGLIDEHSDPNALFDEIKKDKLPERKIEAIMKGGE